MENLLRRHVLHLSVLSLAALLPVTDGVAEDVFQSIGQQVQTVFANAKGAVVRIRATDQHGRCVGSGFFIEPTGLLYTAYAVGGESDHITVEIGDRILPATRLAADRRAGVALLKVETTGTPFLPIGSSRDLAIASPVVAVGYPMDLPASPSFGMIAGFDLKYLDRFFSTTHIRANVPVQRGEGGAPLLNARGEVVGILVSGLDNGAACYALPIEAAEKVRGDYLRYGEVRPGWIGITVSRNAVEAGGSRARIDALQEKSPAAQSGLKDGDIVTRIGKVPVHRPEDVLDGSFFLSAGEDVPVEVLRGDQRLTFVIPAGEHPSTAKSLHAEAPVGVPGESLRLRN